ncbi:MAG TPA: type II secretion system protein GspE [Gammaproteobacteria bacterium]|nr:type II secretion system protein GspE [Gammaproteobacteria bacterium]
MSETLQPSLRFPQPSYGFAKRHEVLVGEDPHGRVAVRFKPPLKPDVIAEVRRFVGAPIRLEPVNDEEFNRTLEQLYDQSGGDAQAMVQDIGEDLDLDQVAESLAESQDLLESEDDAPIIRLINAILTQAIKEGASDIHFEPFESRLAVRLRVDGVLREILQPPKELTPLIVSRLKVMAKLDIAEKRLPQDGRITRSIGGHVIDMRVSTLPSGSNERVVLRLLDRQAGRLTLEQLGMTPEMLDSIRETIKKPHGIFLVTGPTGSGKTTTLYASLSELNNKSRNILTVEDPVEYYIDGIGQTQVNPKVDMSFARGLRAILRQDPDVVMVGEIRDLETAEIAVQASLTGHLVFSTLHTNTATGAVTRLRDMGVEPFLLSSTLLGVLAQRLVRRLCPHCKQPHEATESEIQRLGLPDSPRPVIYSAKGCSECNHSGYLGRFGIYELVLVDEEMQRMIHDGAAEHELDKAARKKTPSIREDGIAKILQGTTSIEEVMRVTREY